jgi:ankyrin repeat protein
VIQLLVETWPDAVKEKDRDEWFPLHCACGANAPFNVIQLLVQTWPNAVKEKNERGWLPLHLACRNNACRNTLPLKVIRLLVETWPQSINETINSGEALYTPLALAKANVAKKCIVSWLTERMCHS